MVHHCIISEATIDKVIEAAKTHRPEIDWAEQFTLVLPHLKVPKFIATWGWADDGTYLCACATRIDESELELFDLIAAKCGKTTSDELRTARLEGREVRFIPEDPDSDSALKPPKEFLKTRPPETLNGKLKLKEKADKEKEFEELEKKMKEWDREGVIKSALDCGNGQTFLSSTKGNYYISTQDYEELKEIYPVIAHIKLLREVGAQLIPTTEKAPNL